MQYSRTYGGQTLARRHVFAPPHFFPIFYFFSPLPVASISCGFLQSKPYMRSTIHIHVWRAMHGKSVYVRRVLWYTTYDQPAPLHASWDIIAIVYSTRGSCYALCKRTCDEQITFDVLARLNSHSMNLLPTTMLLKWIFIVHFQL